MILVFDAATLALLGAVFAPQEAIMPRAAACAESVPLITPRDVALRLYDQGYVTLTLPRREEDLAVVIMKAFEGTGTRFGDLPARRADFAAARQHLELITREAERAGPSLECQRYRPGFMGPLEVGHED